MKRWYVIQSVYGQEENCQLALLTRGYECYLPLTLKDARKRGNCNRLKITEPLYPTYLFVRMDEGVDDFHPLSKVPGVYKIVRLTERSEYLYPTSVPDNLIDALKEMEDEQGIHSHYKMDYERGDRVVITGKHHPFKDFPAEIYSTDKNKRVFALIEIMNRPTKIELEYKDIQPA